MSHSPRLDNHICYVEGRADGDVGPPPEPLNQSTRPIVSMVGGNSNFEKAPIWLEKLNADNADMQVFTPVDHRYEIGSGK